MRTAYQPGVLVDPLVDDDDADLRAFRWRTNRGGYACRLIHVDGRRKRVPLHRIILSRMLGRPVGRADICDHANGDRLDNRRANLRLTDRTGNNQNKRPRNAVGIRGVVFIEKMSKWRAAVHQKHRMHYCGFFDTAEEAGAAAAAKRRELGMLGS